MKTTMKAELRKAKEGHYAVPAFNFDNLEMLKAIIEAAEEEHSPVIIMATESAVKYMGFEYVSAIGHAAVESATVPVILHWDHGFDIELIKKAIDAQYTSVMLDASLKPIAENIAETIAVVEYAHARGVEVESEIGHVGGKEDDRNSKSAHYTTVTEAVDFANKTKIDCLAIAVGTSHGIYHGPVNLQIQRIREIAAEVDQPLVLHGSSGVPYDQLQLAVQAGICKVNIGTDLKVANANGLREWFAQNPQGYDARKFGRYAIDQTKLVAKEKMQVLNSSGKG
ncbi:class II fructose-bisphosphate aldolase [Spiroplasma eriocheiris]|uniref:Tagatose 1,6-diphosphate aldolase GatY n=1 Tax=Spiroplasma eriocheiris TaxID=315358 RepID=A0A0H3XGQ4_9MOLU|nr:class II fructose-bisphosphate aldolase [Spiroplasma eriocheiris]AHF57184.1 fructose/tagatose bisphosphate aldolase [Spiroplasma eriocheiris CCTCC M 207170]AKM53653.1 tagatose 1,6-diphosphate aldolase GatY [Spiroplasma eriocheiris]